MKPEAKARISAGMKRSWARRKAVPVPVEPRSNVHLFAKDAALSVRALLNATKGKLWRLDNYGHPKPMAALYGPLLARC